MTLFREENTSRLRKENTRALRKEVISTLRKETMSTPRQESMNTFRIVLVAAMVASLAGCHTVKGWMSTVGGVDNIHKPADLAKLTPSISVHKLWSHSVGKGERLRGLRDHPAIDGGRVFVEEAYGPGLHALDLATGREIWKSNTKLRLTGSVGAGAGVVVAGSVNGDVVAFAADTGAERWRSKVSSEVLSTPLIVDDMVVVRTGDAKVTALALADGKPRWSADHAMPSLTLRGSSSPVSGNGLVYVGYEDGSIVALRATDGVKVWEQVVAQPEGRSDIDRLADVDGEMLADPEGVFAVSYKGKLGAFGASNGNPAWTHSVVSYGGLARGGNSLFLSDASGTVWSIDRSNGSALWKQDGLAWRWLTTPAVQDGYVVVGDVQGYLHWLKPDTGAIVAREHLGGRKDDIRATPQVSADGVLVAVTAKGKLAAYRISK